MSNRSFVSEIGLRCRPTSTSGRTTTSVRTQTPFSGCSRTAPCPATRGGTKVECRRSATGCREARQPRGRLEADALGEGGFPLGSRERGTEAAARVDPELREHLAQMPLDRARTDEELCADLRIRQAVAREPGDLLLLRCQLVARLGAAFSHLLAGCEQLPAGAFGERFHPDLGERGVGRTQLL